MIHVLVSYRVNPAFVDQNERNIAAFLVDFAQLDSSAFQYSVFRQADGVTFVHLSAYRDEIVQRQVLAIPSFLRFQAERDASGLHDTYCVEIMHLVGSTTTDQG